MPSEEERAMEFRRSQAAREAAETRRVSALAGSASRRQALREAWRPWTDPQPSVVEITDKKLIP
jgi:hypothetical protein